MKNRLPLLNGLLEYHKEKNIIFSMPGNKSGLAFNRDEIGKAFVNNLGYLDITEVEPLDNLHHPEGIIKESQELLAKYYNVKKAFFLVNGSSGGNLTAIFSAFKEGDEVILERNCHKSLYNAVILRRLKVTYIEPLINDNTGLFYPPDKDRIYSALERCNNPKGIILTYPNYFGICYEIEDIIRDLQGKGLKVIIDEAHGAHFGATEKLPKNVAKIADYTVVSAHKTLPALTGGSFLLVNDEAEDLNFYLSSFMTTSPSYLIMASLDYARYYLEVYGEKDYDRLINISEEYKNAIDALQKVKVLSAEDMPKGYMLDLSRYIIILPEGYSGNKFQNYLREQGIQCEMSFHRGVVLLLSYSNVEEGLNKLYAIIKEVDLQIFKEKYVEVSFESLDVEKKMEPFEVFNYKGEWLDYREAEGKVLKDAIVPYPPGIPIACSGEVINHGVIKMINNYIEAGYSFLGVKENKYIYVIH